MNINKHLKEYYAGDRDMLNYINYLIERFGEVEVYKDFHQMVHLLSDIKDYELRFEMQRALSFIYSYFPFGASVTILPPIENGDYEFEFNWTSDIICIDSTKRVKIPLKTFMEKDDKELHSYFMSEGKLK